MSDLDHLLGCRVSVTRYGAHGNVLTHEAILRFLPPGEVVLADPASGRELRLPLSALSSVTDARRACAVCHTTPNNVFDPRDRDPDYAGPRPLCADDYRAWAYQQPPPLVPCPDCDSGDQAFFSPGDKRFCCVQCHQRTGSMLGSTVEFDAIRVQSAPCRSGDIDDPRHDWHHVRGHRYHCRSCHAKRFTDPPLTPAP